VKPQHRDPAVLVACADDPSVLARVNLLSGCPLPTLAASPSETGISKELDAAGWVYYDVEGNEESLSIVVQIKPKLNFIQVKLLLQLRR